MSRTDTPNERGSGPGDDSGLEEEAGSSGFSSFLQRIAATPAVSPELPTLDVGTVLADTYRVEAELGAGGMGVVFRATDLRLKRSVAIKLHTRAPGESDLELLRVEARALAHLTHPNVVEVFEVGTHEERLFIAMEFVDGGTLEEWHTGRSWRAIVGVYLEAGAGLAAAHRAGLVHRDFKPANVLVGRDGRPRVADFGLVLDLSQQYPLSIQDSEAGPVQAIDGQSSPLAGLSEHAMAGTPRYMAPEQAAGCGADHRADQYALCLALFEALTGEVPKDDALAAPGRAGVPPAVWSAIRKGLSYEPEQRHESIDELLEALRAAARPRRRVVWAATAGALGIAGAGVLYSSAPVAPDVQCQRDAESTVSSWEPGRAKMQSLLRKGGDLVRADAFATQLKDYANRWLTMRQNACATGLDESGRDATMRCLSRGARAVQSVVGVLGVEPPEPADPIRRLPLPRLDRCTHERVMESRRPAAGPAIATQVEDVLAGIAKVNALIWHGDTDAARMLAQATLRRANQIQHSPTLVAALLSAGGAELEAGLPKTSHEHYEQAFYLAQSLGYDEEAAEAGGSLIKILSDLGDPRAADKWVQHAMSSFGRLGDNVDPEGEISLLSAVGNLRSEQGRYDEALEIQQRILSALPKNGDEVRRSKAHNSLGATFANMGNSVLAIEHFEIALALNDAVRGPDHPDNIYPLANLAWILIEAKELDRAAPLLDRAIRMLRDKTAEDSYALATLLSHRGALYDERGEHEEALQIYAEGLALAESELGEEHEVTGLLLNNQASSYEALGQIEAARGVYERAVRVLELSENAQDEDLALARANLARLVEDDRPPDVTPATPQPR